MEEILLEPGIRERIVILVTVPPFSLVLKQSPMVIGLSIALEVFPLHPFEERYGHDEV